MVTDDVDADDNVERVVATDPVVVVICGRSGRFVMGREEYLLPRFMSSSLMVNRGGEGACDTIIRMEDGEMFLGAGTLMTEWGEYDDVFICACACGCG